MTRAGHTCIMQASSMHCLACNRGVPYEAPTLDDIDAAEASAEIPSISELRRLCLDEGANHDADLALAAPVLLEIAAAALAFVETQGDRYSKECDLKLALLKVRR